MSHHIFLIYIFFICYGISNRIKTSQNKIKEQQLVLFYMHPFSTLMIKLQYLHVVSKNFISNCLHHIILFIIFYSFINFKFYTSGTVYLLHRVRILAFDG
jgi:hypothetical protein